MTEAYSCYIKSHGPIGGALVDGQAPQARSVDRLFPEGIIVDSLVTALKTQEDAGGGECNGAKDIMNLLTPFFAALLTVDQQAEADTVILKNQDTFQIALSMISSLRALQRTAAAAFWTWL